MKGNPHIQRSCNPIPLSLSHHSLHCNRMLQCGNSPVKQPQAWSVRTFPVINRGRKVHCRKKQISTAPASSMQYITTCSLFNRHAIYTTCTLARSLPSTSRLFNHEQPCFILQATRFVCMCSPQLMSCSSPGSAAGQQRAGTAPAAATCTSAPLLLPGALRPT